jgi:hypothetical protein
MLTFALRAFRRFRSRKRRARAASTVARARPTSRASVARAGASLDRSRVARCRGARSTFHFRVFAPSTANQ